MRAVIQRVKNARVLTDGNLIADIQQGLCVLVGICNEDTEEDLKVMKILNTRFFEDDEGKRWMKNVKDLQLEILCVSQFTLHAKLKKNKPDFSKSMKGEMAQEMYNNLLKHLGQEYDESKIKTGVFGSYMEVQIANDGPVTLQVDSNKNSE